MCGCVWQTLFAFGRVLNVCVCLWHNQEETKHGNNENFQAERAITVWFHNKITLINTGAPICFHHLNVTFRKEKKCPWCYFMLSDWTHTMPITRCVIESQDKVCLWRNFTAWSHLRPCLCLSYHLLSLISTCMATAILLKDLPLCKYFSLVHCSMKYEFSLVRAPSVDKKLQRPGWESRIPTWLWPWLTCLCSTSRCFSFAW